jgi:glutamyl-tRNA reductase
LAAGRATLEDLSVYSWETASLSAEDLSDLESEVGAVLEWSEGVPVVTCQRQEVISLQTTPPVSTGGVREPASAPRQFHGAEALFHIAKVCAGLESLVLGEAEVLGQVRTSLAAASPELRRLTAPAVAAARSLRRGEGFASHAGYALDSAIEYANLSCKGSLTVVGGGPMGRRTAERGAELGFNVTLVARRPLPLPPNIRYRPFDHLAELEATDVLVSCLGHGAPLLGQADIPAIRCAAIDLATPRNLGDDLGVPVVRLADLLHAQRESGDKLQRAELACKLKDLLSARLATGDRESPLGSLREEVERIRQQELVRTLRLHPELPADKVDAITRSLINQIFHQPSQRLRQPENLELAAAVAALFTTIEERIDDSD